MSRFTFNHTHLIWHDVYCDGERLTGVFWRPTVNGHINILTTDRTELFATKAKAASWIERKVLKRETA